MIDVTNRTNELKEIFSFDKKGVVADTGIEIIPFPFIQKNGDEDIRKLRADFPVMDYCSLKDDEVVENKHFKYAVFCPQGKKAFREAVLMLHGLNERTWDKYLVWAEDLVRTLGRPVILFPTSFHVNRAPASWVAPRKIMPWVSDRKKGIPGNHNLSFFNLAISSRMTECPDRFYVSGKETIYNIYQLIGSFRNGENPLIAPDCRFDIFAYSIGSMVAQVMLMSDKTGWFEDSKFISFCGGSTFESLDGEAKDIMDQTGFARIQDYYVHEFIQEEGDDIRNAFRCVIANDRFQEEREKFFQKMQGRVKFFTLKKDVVIPTSGALSNVGENHAQLVEELDFPFEYNHQMPFPVIGRTDPALIYESFRSVFDRVESLLAK